jgi:hypothetical protein
MNLKTTLLLVDIVVVSVGIRTGSCSSISISDSSSINSSVVRT